MTDLASPALDVPRPRVDLQTQAASAGTREEARRLASEFERMFLSEMLQPLFAGLSTEAPFGGGAAENAFRPMLLDQYAGAVAGGRGIGIADAVYREILKLQGLE